MFYQSRFDERVREIQRPLKRGSQKNLLFCTENPNPFVLAKNYYETHSAFGGALRHVNFVQSSKC